MNNVIEMLENKNVCDFVFVCLCSRAIPNSLHTELKFCIHIICLENVLV